MACHLLDLSAPSSTDCDSLVLDLPVHNVSIPDDLRKETCGLTACFPLSDAKLTLQCDPSECTVTIAEEGDLPADEDSRRSD